MAWSLAGALALGACGAEAAPESAEPVRQQEAFPDVPVPVGVVGVPGGTTTVGLRADESGGMPHERPAFDAEVSAFFLDRSPVTVARFRAFVEATGHETEAEGFGDGAVMDPATGQWSLVPGARWRTPFGDGAEAPADHPVTQVSYRDAEAFCTWDGAQSGTAGRLPTEVEWEHAARDAANDRSPYAWGDSYESADANTWTGSFPANDTGADGFEGGTSPVGHYGQTSLGLTDLGGNVWEWTASWYRPYAARDTPYAPTAQSQRVQRGGSFLCHPSYCHGFRVSARSHATPESSFAHVGFRCARDL
ncbi:MAG: formylglycine-generating enzyme family protein [Bacteroidota bacterium]